MITPEQLNSLGLFCTHKEPHLYHDMEDVLLNIRTKELFYLDCRDGSLTLYRKVKDCEDLVEALYDGFGITV